MSVRFNRPVILAHVVDAMTQMRVVIIHHVAEEAVKVFEAALFRKVRRFKTEVPLTYERRLVTLFLSNCGRSVARGER